MLIGVISDIHDNIPNLRSAVAQLMLHQVDLVLSCGDWGSTFTVRDFAERWQKPAHIVWGNNDGERERKAWLLARYPHIQLHGEQASLVLDDLRVGLTHYPKEAQEWAKLGLFDVVFFGHSHRYEVTPLRGALVINPGEILGHLTGVPSLVLFDTATRQVRRVDVPARPMTAPLLAWSMGE